MELFLSQIVITNYHTKTDCLSRESLQYVNRKTLQLL